VLSPSPSPSCPPQDKPLKPLASGAANIIFSGTHLEPTSSSAAAAAAALSAAAASGGAEGGFALPRSRAGAAGPKAPAAPKPATAPTPSPSAASHVAAPTAAAAAAPAGTPEGEPFIRLGGLEEHVEGILRCRRIVFIACGTSYHACLSARKTLEEFAAMPVVVELAGDFMVSHPPVPSCLIRGAQL
jgi:hypothetical protein